MMQFSDIDNNQFMEYPRDVLNKTRDKILRSVTYTFSIIVLPALFLSVKEALQNNLIIEAVIYLLAYIVWLVFGLFLLKRLKYEIRAATILVLLFVVGDFILLQRGLSGAGTLFLATFCVMATTLLGLKYGMLAIAMSITSIIIIGWAMVEKLIPFDPEMVLNSISIFSWILAGAVFLVLSISMVWTSGIIQSRLQNALSLLRNSQNKIVFQNEALIREIEERKKSEKQKRQMEIKLLQAQKMEAIGTLAGGVAHDLSNILSGIVSYPELIMMDLPEDSPLRKPILTIQKSGEKAAVIVQDLLTLARRGVAITEIVNLNHIISEQLKSPEFEKLMSYSRDVEVETHFEKDLLNIKGSSVHLSKSVMNLISNAAEAMVDGGTISLSTENRYIDRPIKDYDHIEEGDYAVITVSDTGVGMSSEDMEKIFEPFYTKKTMGRSGTGLGMAVVWGTVKDHNGYIDLMSTVGKGTTFTLFFPATREKAPSDKTLLSIEDYMGKGETVLVIDDVEEQREIASDMLRKLGYSVTPVSSGEEAVEYLKNNSVDLLVLDMIMEPGIDGLETYKRILKLHPRQKAIIASGFAETPRVKEVIKLGAGSYVKKPYLIETIGVVIRGVFEK